MRGGGCCSMMMAVSLTWTVGGDVVSSLLRDKTPARGAWMAGVLFSGD